MQNPDHTIRSMPSRRDVILLGIGAFAVATVPFARRRPSRLVRRRLPLMGTVAEIAVVHRDPGFAQHAIDAAFEELRDVESAMTRFTTTSDVGRANLSAAKGPVRVSSATASVLREALAWAVSSDGAFDPGVGKVVELWDVANRQAPPPSAAVERLAGRRLYRALDLDSWSGTPVVRFTEPDVAIDLGGIAKGYGVDRAVSALRNWGIRDGLVNVGGDLYALGESDDGDPWNVGVRSPLNPQRIAGRLEVADAAVATSGDYVQYFEYGGRRYHHLLDPDTGRPRVSELHSVTVTADTCMAADAAATAAFGMPPHGAATLLRSRAPGARVVTRI
jgi:thiamine biosynthesis lipoprotein